MRPAAVNYPSAVEYSGEVQLVEAFLAALAARLRLLRILRSICISVTCSCLSLTAVRVLSEFAFQRQLSFFFVGYVVSALVAVPALIVTVRLMLSNYETIELARYADDRFKLKDRLATAITLRLSLMDPEFARRIAQDAALAVAGISLQESIPLKWHRAYTAALLAVLAATIVLYMPLSPLAVVRLPSFSGSVSPYSLPLPKVKSNSPRPTVVNPRLIKGSQTLQPPKANSSPPTKHGENTGESAPGNKQVSATAGQENPGSASHQNATNSAKISDAASQVDKMINSLKSTSGNSNKAGSKPVSQAGSQKPASLGKDSVAGSNKAAEKSPAIPTLGDKLRAYADNLSKRTLTSGEQQQAAQNLDQVNHKLDGLQMPKTQQNLSDAEQNLNSGQQNEAISNIRQAAYNADHEGASAPSSSGAPAAGSKDDSAIPAKQGQPGGQSSNSQSSEAGKQVAGQSPGGVSGKNGNGSSASGGQNGNSAPNGSKGRSGAGNGAGEGTVGKDIKSAPNSGGSGKGYGGGTQKPTFGAPRLIDPSKIGAPTKFQYLPLPESSTKGRSSEVKGYSAPAQSPGVSTVPYSNVNETYKMSHERGVTTEQIPPAYNEVVRRYFSSSHAGH